jgi:hypothetical protein
MSRIGARDPVEERVAQFTTRLAADQFDPAA